MKIGYDFNNYQMYCDDALITLDLATKGSIGPEECILYLNNSGTNYE